MTHGDGIDPATLRELEIAWGAEYARHVALENELKSGLSAMQAMARRLHWFREAKKIHGDGWNGWPR